MRKIRTNDEVIVIAGRDKGRRGEVIQVLGDGRLVVSGINLVKKHTRADPYRGVAGGIQEHEAPIQASNVAIFNRETGKADRVGIRDEDGRRIRYFKRTGEAMDD
jgi:large subunit ribosomal protein L24